MFGIAPTGKKITTTAIDIYRIVNGKLAEYWNVTDKLSLYEPQGIVEYTEKGKKLFPQDAK
jgi:predicted ester cyclase